MLSSILPHLGGNCLDVVTEISQLGLIKDDTLNTLYLKFSLLSRRLKISGYHVSATSLITRYFHITMGFAELKSLLTPIFRVYQKHLNRKGQYIPFTYDIKYLHKFLNNLNVPMEALLPTKKTVTQTFKQHDTSIIPPAMVAMGYCQGIDKEPPTPTQAQYRNNRNTQYNKNKTFHQCIICNERHMETNFIHCGEEWKPKWIIKNTVKYNATHPNNKPNQDIVNADPPLRQSKTQ